MRKVRLSNRSVIILSSVFAFFLLILSGCGSQRAVIPVLSEKMSGRGLLVGNFAMPGNIEYEGGVYGTSVIIDGYTYNNAFRKGLIALPLPPGEHRVDSIRRVVGNHIYTAPIKRSVTIENGKITNLGLIVALIDVDNNSKYSMVFLDNSREMEHYLKSLYPKQYNALSDKTIHLSQGKFLETKHIPAVRNEIARRIYIPKDELTRYFNPVLNVNNYLYVFGDAGTIYSVKIDDKKKVESREQHDTKTLADIIEARVRNGKVYFLSDDARLYLVEGHEMQSTPIGLDIKPVDMYLHGDKGIVIVDSYFRIHTSLDDGRSWTSYSGAEDTTGSTLSLFTKGKDSFYVYGDINKMPERIVRISTPELKYEKIAPPSKHRENANGQGTLTLVEKESGLFLDYGGNGFFIRQNGHQQWLWREKPRRVCGTLSYLDNSGSHLKVQCKDDHFESSDTGNSWQQI